MPRNKFVLNMSLAGAVLLLSGGAPATHDSVVCDKSPPPNKMEGQISRIDRDRRVLELRKADGTSVEFQVAPETLNQYAVGDHIRATLRSAPDCGPSAS